MKKQKHFVRLLAGLLLASVLLTACAEKPTSTKRKKTEESTSTTSTSNAGTFSPEQLLLDAEQEIKNAAQPESDVDFAAVFAAMEVSDTFKNAHRHVIIEDYDGDGKNEAFGFYGLPVFQDDGTMYFEQFNLYFISSDGTISYIDGNENPDGAIYGMIEGLQTTRDEEVSAELFETEGQKFLPVMLGYPESSWFTMMVSVYDGNWTASYVGGGFCKTEDGRYISVDEMDGTYEYILQNGQFIEK